MQLAHCINVAVRDAQPTDFLQVQAILNDNLKEDISWRTQPATYDDIAHWHPLADGGKAEFLVATDREGSVLGFVTAGQMHPDRGFKTSASLSIYTAPTRQDLGVGSELLDALVHRLAAQDFRTLVAFVDGNNVNSLTWHSRRGFDFAGRLNRVGIRDGAARDLVLLVRQIEPVCDYCGACR